MNLAELHPAIGHGDKKGAPGFGGGTLKCHCAHDAVEVRVDTQVAHNHACGCSKCWKPDGAIFSVVGLLPRDKVHLTAHAEKLHVVTPQATLHRPACKVYDVPPFCLLRHQVHAFYCCDFLPTTLPGSPR